MARSQHRMTAPCQWPSGARTPTKTGDYDLDKAMPPGTEVYQGELAPSGHMVLPCCEFSNNGLVKSESSTLTLVTKQAERREPEPSRPSQPPGLGPCYQ